jgi:hypothetical protein
VDTTVAAVLSSVGLQRFYESNRPLLSSVSVSFTQPAFIFQEKVSLKHQKQNYIGAV